MSQVFIPHPERTRALLLVDIQDGFLNERNKWIIPNIKHVVTKGNYALMVEINFYAEHGSLWDKQTDWTFALEPTTFQIKKLLGDNVPLITKTAKSAFKGDKNLLKILKKHQIEEVHITGLDTNDCVLATAQESFDLGFFTYVLEECTESSEGQEYRDAALLILRELDMTIHLKI